MWYIYTIEYLLSHKEEWNNAICINMDETRGYHTKWGKSGKKRQKPYDITYMWNLKYDTNELLWNGNWLTDVENTLVVANGVGGLRKDELRVWD